MRISDWSSDVCSSDLKYRLNFGPDLRTTNGGRFIGSMTNTKQGGSNEASTTKNDTRAYTLENILTLNKRFNEAHALDLTLMQSIQHQTVETSFRSEEHTSELQSLMRISYAVFCLKKKTRNIQIKT